MYYVQEYIYLSSMNSDGKNVSTYMVLNDLL